MKKKLLALTLSALTALSLIPSVVFAQPVSEPEDSAVSEIAAQLQDPTNNPFDNEESFYTAKAMNGMEEKYPSSFDLRNVDGKSYVTPVKTQSPFGTCWGFAAIAAAESSILGSGLAEADGFDEKTLDLSEKHLAYFASQAIKDPDNPQFGEGLHAKPGMTEEDLLNIGKYSFTATSLFASGIGPILENEDPLLKYMGKNGWTEKHTVNGKVVNYYYSEDDDWTLPEEWRFRQSYVLSESFMLPSPAITNKETDKYTYNEAGTFAIKEMLLNKRAVQISFYADSSSPGEKSKDGQFISKNWAHYTYDSNQSPNHSVTIVGWDDNYDKSNFIKGHRPPANGAWLAKNSWGSGEEPFPNCDDGDWGIPVPKKDADGKIITDEKGNPVMVGSGYFWLSYYDKTLFQPEALAFEKSNVNNRYIIDEHDFMPVNGVSAAKGKNPIKTANVFRAEECETLYKVSCETTYPGTKVLNEVYLLPNRFSSPTDGKLVDRTEETFEYGGFHTMNLESPDIIQKKQFYAIVQTQFPPEEGYTFSVHYTSDLKTENGSDPDTWVEGVVNPGESFVYLKDKWYDFSGKKIRKQLFGNKYRTLIFDNFPIKGYCRPKENIRFGTYGLTQIPVNDTESFHLYYIGDENLEFDLPAITWELAEGGEKYFTLTQDQQQPDEATITAKASGSTLLYVTAEGLGTSVFKLTAEKRKLFDAVYHSLYTYNGKYHEPKPVVRERNGEVIPASHYTVSYKNNKKCGKAETIIRIKKGDPIYEGSYISIFTIRPRQAVIRSLSAGKGELKLTVRDEKSTGAKYYQVNYRIKGTSKWKYKSFKVASGNKLVLKKLEKGRQYQIRVCSIAPSFDEGKYSSVKTSKPIQ